MPFEYNYKEKILMAIITGLSNISSVPITLLTYKKGNTFVFMLAVFSIITSFFYHICESLDIVIFLRQLKWHELDNIGAICSLNSLILVLTRYHEDIEKQKMLNYFSIFMALLFQERNPWDLTNTLLPIFIFLFIAIYDWIKVGRPKFNYEVLWVGGVFLVAAIAMFVKGLDDGNDYLRIYHSLWHILIGISTFFLWQLQEKEIINLKEIFSVSLKKQKEII